MVLNAVYEIAKVTALVARLPQPKHAPPGDGALVGLL
jgi:hypothetical protein